MLKTLLSVGTYVSFVIPRSRLLSIPLAFFLWKASPFAFFLTIAAIVMTVFFIHSTLGVF